jgi:hypothetical protein
MRQVWPWPRCARRRGVQRHHTGGFIGCRECQSWESLLSIDEAKDLFEAEKWVVLEAGQGTFDNDAERQKTITYRDPEADQSPRYGVTP